MRTRPAGRPAEWEWRRMLWVVVAVSLMAVAGCKPKQAPSPPPAESGVTNVTPAGPPTGAAATASADLPQVNVAADGEPDLHDLNRYVLRWAIAHQRRPMSFEEFAADPGVKIPPAPAGKKYVLDHTMHIVLVNQ